MLSIASLRQSSSLHRPDGICTEVSSNFLWMLFWAIVEAKVSFSDSTAWAYYAIIHGGSRVFSCVDVSLTVLLWALRLSPRAG
jgi:hypothetical protein